MQTRLSDPFSQVLALSKRFDDSIVALVLSLFKTCRPPAIVLVIPVIIIATLD